MLQRSGISHRRNDRSLPGKPDFVLVERRTVVFCDGDFWHGRDWDNRRSLLARGHNADYWVRKIERNRERDRSTTMELERLGWRVLRLWASDVVRDPDAAAAIINGC